MPTLNAPRFSIDRPFGHEPDSVRRVRAAWISDVHLGTRGANAGTLLDFLREYEFETLYVVGDLIDIWQLRRGRYWPQLHNDVIQKILRKSRKGTRVVYIPGNHDEMPLRIFWRLWQHYRTEACHSSSGGRTSHAHHPWA